MSAPRSWVVWLVGLVVLLSVGFPALLYAYRSQSPAVQAVPMTQAVSEIQDGRVGEVVIEENRATLTLRDGSRQVTNVPFPDDTLVRAVAQRNQSDPSHPIQLRTQQQSSPLPFVISVVLSLLPLALLVALVVLSAYAIARGRRPDAYERLARIADLRDRGVLTEEEFQREKRKLLG
jgi:ATP-dependent Zn protease